jgi:hypothetical protein
LHLPEKGDLTMNHVLVERVRTFDERHRAIDLLRDQRELGGSLAYYPAAVRSLLQEIDLLQVVAQAAEYVAAYPVGESAAETLAQLRYSLDRWKE